MRSYYFHGNLIDLAYLELLVGACARVAIDFGSLFFTGQHANGKSRGPICMLGLLFLLCSLLACLVACLEDIEGPICLAYNQPNDVLLHSRRV